MMTNVGTVPNFDRSLIGMLLAGDPRAHRALGLVRALPADRLDAFLRYSERMAAGMPVAEAQAMMLQECGRAPA